MKGISHASCCMDALFLGKDSPRAASGLFKKRQTTLILVGDYTGWKASKLACMNHASLSLEIKKRTITIMGLITSLESAPRKALSCNHLFTSCMPQAGICSPLSSDQNYAIFDCRRAPIQPKRHINTLATTQQQSHSPCLICRIQRT